MTPNKIPSHRRTFLCLVLCALVSTIVFVASPVFARSSPVIEADDPSLVREGKPHDWDSPQGQTTYSPIVIGAEEIVSFEDNASKVGRPTLSQMTSQTTFSDWLRVLVFSTVWWD